ncbi:MAG: 30S ribosomal protein S6 [bacterium]
MRFYETIFIVKSDLAEEALAERVAWATDILTSNGAQIVNVEEWGKKRLAYQVNKQRYGLYVLLHYEAEKKVLLELERNFKLSEDVLKYLTVRLEGKLIEKARAAAVKAAEEAVRREEEAAKRAEEPPAPEEAPETESAPEAVAEQETESAPPPEATPEAVSEQETESEPPPEAPSEAAAEGEEGETADRPPTKEAE